MPAAKYIVDLTAEEREILLQELVFADDAVAMLDQIDEDVEHLRLELDELAGIAQLIALQVEFVIISEDVDHRHRPLPDHAAIARGSCCLNTCMYPPS
jgi:hypothetical protein